jgi:DNA-binding CsgD family transcriptional regulator
MARTERDSLVLLPAYATDGILAADARSQGAGRQLRRAVALFEEDFDALPSSHRDPLWVELIGHVRVTRGEEREVHDLVRPCLADGSIGAAQRQRLECLLAAAELGCGHLFQAAAALTEAAVPTGMLDQERTRWAELTLGQLTGARRDSAGLSSEELRVLAAVEEGLDDAQTAHRLALSTRAVRFYRSLVQEKLTARHRSA